MTKLLTAFVIIVVSTMATSTLLAQDYDSGNKAYEAGDYATALKIWTPLAEQGLAQAQNNLRLIYARGTGTIQDTMAAHMHRRCERG
jgi:TPR repeat protein